LHWHEKLFQGQQQNVKFQPILYTQR